MVRANDALALARTKTELEVELIAVIDESTDSQRRTEEVRELVIKMILLGRKKGRPSVREQEFDDAA